MSTPNAMFRILSVTCLLTGKALRLIIIPDWRMCLMFSDIAYVYICAFVLRIIFTISILVVVPCVCVCVCVYVCVCVCVRSFLPSRASRL